MKSFIKDNKCYLMGFMTIVCAVLSIGFSTVAHFVPIFLIGHYAFEVLAIVLYWACFTECRRAGKGRLLKEIALLNLLTAVILICVFIRSIPVLLSEGWAEYIFSEFLVVAAVVGLIVYDCVRREYIFGRLVMEMGTRAKRFFVDHICLCIVLILLTIVGILSGGNQPRWDAAYVFRYLDNCSVYSIFYIPQLSFISHLNMSYSALNLIAELLAGDLLLGMTILNIAVFTLSGFCMYGVIRIIVPNRSELTYILGTAAYSCSPFLLGMVNNNYWDYWVVCLLPVLYYLILRKYWVLETAAAFIFCFIKETSVVVYAFMCLGILVQEWSALQGISMKDRCRILAGRSKYWFMLLTGMIWVGIYIILPNWEGNGAFRLNMGYIRSKLSVLYGINFNWLLALAGLVGVIGLAVRKKKGSAGTRWVLPLLLGDLSFIVFSCLFVTVNHARYINAHFPILFLFSIFGICMIPYDKLVNVLLSALAVMMLVQSYYTIDPISKLLFDNYNVGTTIMISATRNTSLEDSMVYNQQYQYFDRALNLALEDAVHDPDAIIIFPAVYNRTWAFDGFAETTESVEEYIISTEYWDDVKKMRCIFPADNRFRIEVYNVSEQKDWSSIMNDGKGYYFYAEIAGEQLAEKIRADYHVLEETDWEYGGWTVHRIEFSE